MVREVFLEEEGLSHLKDEGVGASHTQSGRSSRKKERKPNLCGSSTK